MADGFFGNLLSGAKNIGTNLMNIPANLGQRYEAGELFGGGGALGGLLGPEARKQAQDEAITKMGLSLLGQGPSRTPISFGQSLAQGLGAGQEAYSKGLLGNIQEEMMVEKLQDAKSKRKAMDVLVDKNATAEDLDAAFRTLDPAGYLKAKTDKKSLSEMKADYLAKLQISNPSEYEMLIKKSIEGQANPFGFLNSSGGFSVSNLSDAELAKVAEEIKIRLGKD